MTVPTFTITAVPRFLVTCDVPACQWRQEHTTQDNAARDGQRHLEERHAQDIDEVYVAARQLVERLACLHEFDPECSRCELMLPLRRALIQTALTDQLAGQPTRTFGPLTIENEENA